MANTLQIEKVLSNRFEFVLNGGNVISAIYPRLFTDGSKCDFKTSSGANIIKKQNIDVTEITVIDTFGGSGTFTFTNAIQLWSKLTELDFFGESSGGGGGVTTFTGLSDTTSYFGNDGKVPIVNESENQLDYTTFYNFDKLTQLNDVEIETLVDGKVLGVTLVGGVPKVTMINKPADGTTYFSAVGGFDYNDLATQSSPLAYTTGDLQLPNDTLGAYTFLSQPPYGITGVWDEDTDTLNFSQLSVGDEVFLRIDISHTTTANNQKTNLYILFGEGTGSETRQKICPEITNKDAGSDEIVFTYNFQIRNNEWRTAPAKIIYSSDASSSVVVNGWHPYIIRKSVNIIDVNDDNFRTFTVSQIASPTVDVLTNEGTVKIGYEGTGNTLTNIIFDKAFSKYLSGFSDILGTKRLELKIYNKTKQKTLNATINAFNYTDVSNDYYNVSIENIINFANVSVDDKLEINLDVSGLGGFNNIDGGSSSSVFLTEELTDGGGA